MYCRPTQAVAPPVPPPALPAQPVVPEDFLPGFDEESAPAPDLLPVKTTPNGHNFVVDDMNYHTTVAGERGMLIGKWVRWGAISDAANIAITCLKHKKCTRSASTRKYRDAEGVVVDWLIAGLPEAVNSKETHSALPRPATGSC